MSLDPNLKCGNLATVEVIYPGNPMKQLIGIRGRAIEIMAKRLNESIETGKSMLQLVVYPRMRILTAF